MIECITTGELNTNSYIISNEKKECTLIILLRLKKIWIYIIILVRDLNIYMNRVQGLK